MSRETWSLLKQNRSFNVNVFRRGLLALILSLGISCIIVLLIFYIHSREPEPDFYATNGVTPPIMLKALQGPNMSSTALLESDPPNDDGLRVIPQ